jgi:hypothetical protein
VLLRVAVSSDALPTEEIKFGCRTLAVFKGAGFRSCYSIRFIDDSDQPRSDAEEGYAWREPAPAVHNQIPIQLFHFVKYTVLTLVGISPDDPNRWN